CAGLEAELTVVARAKSCRGISAPERRAVEPLQHRQSLLRAPLTQSADDRRQQDLPLHALARLEDRSALLRIEVGRPPVVARAGGAAILVDDDVEALRE